MTQLDFIHIGLGKCMSSRLQGHWGEDAAYNALNADAISGAIDQFVRDDAASGEQIDAGLARLNLNFPAFDPNVTNILTSEALTFSYLHNPELGEAIVRKDEAASKLLAPLTDKVLLMVRNPVSWIKSCYAQQIKEGGCVPLDTYLASHRAIILNNLNLERRIAAWSRFGAEVVLLPMELARQNDAAFWSAYEERLGVRRPSNWSKTYNFITTNETRYETLEPHRRMNQILHLLERSLRTADLKQKRETLSMMETARRFGVRWGCSAADDKTMNEICTALNMDLDQTGPGDLMLDDEILTTIEKTFLQPLRDDPHFASYGGLESYAESLDAQPLRRAPDAAVSGAAAG